jgi:hypothetical protein
VVASRARRDGLGAAGVALVLDPAAATGGDPGAEREDRDEDGDDACQFFELDSKNLHQMSTTGRTNSAPGFIEFVGYRSVNEVLP